MPEEPDDASFQSTLMLHAYIHAHTYIHAHIHACMHTYMHACIHTCTHAHIHTYIHMRTRTHGYIRTTHIHTCTHTYMHAHIHTCMHTYIHTYIHIHHEYLHVVRESSSAAAAMAASRILLCGDVKGKVRLLAKRISAVSPHFHSLSSLSLQARKHAPFRARFKLRTCHS
jgi:hypothetical protein